MAQEQIVDASTVDHRADQWALAKTLHWLLTGKPTVVRERDLPAMLREPLMRALEDQPEERFRDMQQFAMALRTAASRGSATVALSTCEPEPMAEPTATINPDLFTTRAAGAHWAELIHAAQANVAQQHAQARELLAAQRYAEALASLDQIPKQQRHLLDQRLYQECERLRDQVRQLDHEVDAAVRALQFTGLREKVLMLQRLQAWRKDLRGLLQTMPADTSVGQPSLLKLPFSPRAAKTAQVAVAQWLQQPEEWTNCVGMNFRPIPAGTFGKMTITKPFWLGVCQVTQRQWEQVMGTTPWKGKLSQVGSDVAASYVAWHHAVEFSQKLSRMDGRNYRLPTEAEWEWACRAGTTTAFSFGDDERLLGEHAWFDGNRTGAFAHRVGQKQPNPFGLFDLHGNLWEWCSDWYGGMAPAEIHGSDPRGPGSGTSRILRGGSWLYDAFFLRSACRHSDTPGDHHCDIGCRMLCE
ncbi:MAG: SUMF1/EgtB/PvdO family nonheme iron enzyme [Planctomycetota bacterium]